MNDLEQRIASLPPRKRELLLRQLAQRGVATAAPVERIPRQPRDTNRFPVSFSQLREWLLMQLEPGTAAYNIPGAMRLTGRLDPVLLERAVQQVVDRHESLRTTFAATPTGEPVQVVAPRVEIRLPLIDLTALAASIREDVARCLAQLEVDTPFDLERGPLVRATVLRLGGDDHALLTAMHHSISDGWSTRIFFEEVSHCYAALASGRPAGLPELPIQYPDFAVWQRQRLHGGLLKSHADYWRRQLGGAPPYLDLPTDRPRPSVRSRRGARMDFRLSEKTTAMLRDLARQESASLFMALLAVFKVLLQRYSLQDDLSVGTFISNRRQAELDRLIGFFVNTLVLRTDLSGDPTFRLLLRRVRETTLGAYAHQDLPFERVLDALRPARDVSRTPLFQVLMTLQNFPARKVETGDLTIAPMPFELDHAEFEMSLMLEEAPHGGVGGYCEYIVDLFERESVRRLLARFYTLAEAAAADPDRPISALPLVPEPERRRIEESAAAASATGIRRPGRCMHELVAAQAMARPEAVALEFEDSRVTYSELMRRATALAQRLRELGIGPEALAGIAIRRSPGMVVAALGVLEAGGGYLPLDLDYPRERLAFMLADARATALVAEEGLSGLPIMETMTVVRLTAEGLLVDLVEAGDGRPAAEPVATAPPGVTPGNVAYVIYTSGSTGRPKGVVVEHRALAGYAEDTAEAYGILPGDKVLQFSSFSFDISAEEIYTCLSQGARLVLRNEAMAASVPRFLAELDRLGITVASLPTAFVHELISGLDAEGLTLPPRLRVLVIGGEKLLADRVELWHRQVGGGVRLINTYGPTEATIVATRYEVPFAPPPDPGQTLPDVPIGRAIAGAETWVLDRRLEPVPDGLPGELYIGGAGVARSYLGRPDLTAERFVPHPFARRADGNAGARLYRTGDLVRRRLDGELLFLGRADSQIKLRGYRIEPGEIETALRRHPAVRNAVVEPRQDRQGNFRLVAYVVREGEVAASVTELRGFLKEGLPDYMVPSLFVDIPALPLTPGGKLDRRALPEPEADRPDLAAAYVPPRTDLERALVDAWRQVLPVDRIGVHDSFFDLGGDSLLLLQVHRRLGEALGSRAAELSVIDLFQYPTVAALARHIADQTAETEAAGKADLERVQDRVSQQRAALARQKQRTQQVARPPARGAVPGSRPGPGERP